MRNPRLPLRATACLAALCIIGVTTVQAKQTCSTAAGSQGYWSWRQIDGRKCWYEGKPMLSKSLLEWPAEDATPKAAVQQAATPKAAAPKAAAPKAAALPPAETDAVASAPAMRHSDPLDAQASMRNAPATFDALWRSRIENR